MFDPTFPAYPIFSLLTFILVLIPLPWHFQAWNSGTCLYMIWTAIGCLNYFVNSVVWHANAIDWAPIWCDISTRLTVGLSVAIPAASLCINRRLYKIASVQTVSISRVLSIWLLQKRRAVMTDLAIGLGIPFTQMGLQMIVEGHRYDIWEDIGCLPKTFNTPPAYPLSILWPLVIGLISAVYCLLTLRAFMIRRVQFQQLLARNSSLTVNRYFRLMSLATLELSFNTPISAYGLYLTITSSEIQPWRGLADAHFDWYTIDTFPAVLWRGNRTVVTTLELTRWSIVFCGLVFFAFFGFAEEARRHYRMAYEAVAKKLGILLPRPSSGAMANLGWKKNISILPMSNASISIPVFTQKLHSTSSTLATPPKYTAFSSDTSRTSYTDTTSSICRSPITPVFKAHADTVPPILPTMQLSESLRPSSSQSSLPMRQPSRDPEGRKSLYFVAL
ncbi:pheromone receptor [Pleurotus eryngii]|uniref:Pheromone receptor n=1 Tax=Pleurotus eryngii TaxID=5323 RepID=A0A9P6DFM5_PLEER|nr:pheromone receptor [Pleurotus eryngii]